MAGYTENTTLGKILEEHPEAEELLNSAARLQVDRFKNQELFMASPYLGMSKDKMQAFLNDVNKL